MEKKNKGIKRLRLINIAKDGKGVSKKKADLGTGFKRFFHTYKNNFGKLITVNIDAVLHDHSQTILLGIVDIVDVLLRLFRTRRKLKLECIAVRVRNTVTDADQMARRYGIRRL